MQFDYKCLTADFSCVCVHLLLSCLQAEENEELPDNLKDIFGKKSSLSESSVISDHSAQSSISEPDDGLPNEELTRVLGLLSEEQAKSRSLQDKVDSLEKQLESKKEVEKELEKTKSRVSELNRRIQDTTRAYEQEKRVSDVHDLSLIWMGL